MAFIESAHNKRIIVMILPPHSTHRLQPLDVGLFGPLSTAYSQQLNNLIHTSMGLVSMTKRLFWPLFWQAWIKAFTSNNITSAFQATGIWPLNPDVILVKLQKTPSPPPNSTNSVKTPSTSRGLRRLHRKIKQQPTDDNNLDKLLRASERLAARQEILVHEVTGLRQAIQHEKKKRNRGKRLNLVGDEAGGPILFSPGQVLRARATLEQKEQEEIDKRAGIEARKVAAAAAREKKALDKVEKAEAIAIRRQEKAAEKARLAEERKARREVKKASTMLQTLDKSLKKTSTKRKRAATTSDTVVVVEKEEVVRTGLQGRSIKLPRRFKQ